MGENKKRDPHSLHSVKVGDMVVMSNDSRESREVQVTKIGRKYLSAGGYQFDFYGVRARERMRRLRGAT